MKVLFINANCGVGSTGRICTDLYSMLKTKKHEAKIAYATTPAIRCDTADTYRIHGKADYYIHNFLAKLTDRTGLFSSFVTRRLTNYITEENPDIIHLHNLHGYYLNYDILFSYLESINKPVVWTLHDCWAFTGHCAHFDMYGCEKWKTECSNCNHLYTYPKSWFFDNSKSAYNLKKRLTTNLKDKLVLVPVSHWLEDLVKQSFLKNHRIITIPNGIDLSVFKPQYDFSIIEKYNLAGKKILLGVASPWSEYKGLPDFFTLREKLDSSYAIILVGLSAEQIRMLPQGIIGLERTNSIEQLAQLYSLSDVFINTTYCDNYPTVNLESISCGTPVITYDTGGSPEAVDDCSGRVVAQGCVDEIITAINDMLNMPKSEMRAYCRKRAENFFDKNKQFDLYYNIYKGLI